DNIAPGTTVTLDGSASYDSDGTIVSYLWTQYSGEEVTITNPTNPVASFIAPNPTYLSTVIGFSLTATDSDGYQSTSYTFVSVTTSNATPVADAGADTTVNEGQTATLDGSASYDPDGTIATVIWTRVDSLPYTIVLADPTSLTTTFTAPDVGAGGATFTFNLLVYDDKGTPAYDEVLVTVNDVATVNHPPSPPNKAISTTRDSSGSVAITAGDPDAGDTFQYSIKTLPAHGAVALSASGLATYVPELGFTGSDSFSVTVTDNHGASGFCVVSVTVTAPSTVIDEPVLVISTTFTGDPASTFTDALAVLIEDISGDGYADMAVGDATGAGVFVYLGNAAGGFSATPLSFPAGGKVLAITSGDINGDGVQDLVLVVDTAVTGRKGAAVSGGFNLSVLLSDGSGGYEDPAVDTSGSVAPSTPATGDLDGDGADEIAAAGAGAQGNNVVVYDDSDPGAGFTFESLLIPSPN
ncbi:MAG: hypothetical protein FDZ70_10680, partial [Actinobacteria bacterium]